MPPGRLVRTAEDAGVRGLSLRCLLQGGGPEEQPHALHPLSSAHVLRGTCGCGPARLPRVPQAVAGVWPGEPPAAPARLRCSCQPARTCWAGTKSSCAVFLLLCGGCWRRRQRLGGGRWSLPGRGSCCPAQGGWRSAPSWQCHSLRRPCVLPAGPSPCWISRAWITLTSSRSCRRRAMSSLR